MVFSGFLLQLHSVPFWGTAGHCLKDIDPFIESSEIKIIGGAFLDHFGHLAIYEEDYPYTYERGDAYYIYDKDDGLDFALIRLDNLQEQAFLQNGLMFISRVNWEHQHKLEFDSYLMLGIKEGSKIIQENGKTKLMMEQATVKVEEISRDDIDITKMPPEETELPAESWFIGKAPPKEKIDTVKGLSGGPIYGFRRDEEGRLTYHVVALQSHWWWRSRIVFGCPLNLFAEWCYQQLKRVFTEMEEKDATT